MNWRTFRRRPCIWWNATETMWFTCINLSPFSTWCAWPPPLAVTIPCTAPALARVFWRFFLPRRSRASGTAPIFTHTPSIPSPHCRPWKKSWPLFAKWVMRWTMRSTSTACAVWRPRSLTAAVCR